MEETVQLNVGLKVTSKDRCQAGCRKHYFSPLYGLGRPVQFTDKVNLFEN